eukprot:scaffold1744_cov252-Pinguiococcus_pyrenoidosus.AAC.14
MELQQSLDDAGSDSARHGNALHHDGDAVFRAIRQTGDHEISQLRPQARHQISRGPRQHLVSAQNARWGVRKDAAQNLGLVSRQRLVILVLAGRCRAERRDSCDDAIIRKTARRLQRRPLHPRYCATTVSRSAF